MKKIIQTLLLLSTLNFLAQTPSDKLKDFSFEKLNINDSIILKGEIADCGEFGSHKEFIVCYKLNNHVNCKFYKEQSTCNTNELIEKNDMIVKFYKINPELIYSYLKKFNSFKGNIQGESNAPTEFYIRLNGEIIFLRDELGRWEEFNKLRDELFKK